MALTITDVIDALAEVATELWELPDDPWEAMDQAQDYPKQVIDAFENEGVKIADQSVLDRTLALIRRSEFDWSKVASEPGGAVGYVYHYIQGGKVPRSAESDPG